MTTDEMIDLLGTIAENIGGEWEQSVMLNNDEDNYLIDSYNDGVRAMASTACRYIQAILSAKNLERIKKGGTICFPEKEGEE